MKITFLLLLSFLILSVNQPKKNKISEEIIGVWVYHTAGSFNKGPIRIWTKTKREPRQYDGFVFKKAGELVVHSQIDYAGDDELYEHVLFPSKWSILDDSTVQIDYTEDTLEIRQKFRFYENGARGFELRRLSSILISQ
nr:hypothetical protein [uncultured Fluviicola sp.]